MKSIPIKRILVYIISYATSVILIYFIATIFWNNYIQNNYQTCYVYPLHYKEQYTGIGIPDNQYEQYLKLLNFKGITIGINSFPRSYWLFEKPACLPPI